jgi:hypothetical protein
VIRAIFAPYINKQISKANKGVIHFPSKPGEVVTETLPEVGIPGEKLLAQAKELHQALDISSKPAGSAALCTTVAQSTPS